MMVSVTPPDQSKAVKVPVKRSATPQPDALQRSFAVVPPSGIISLGFDPPQSNTATIKGTVVHLGNQIQQEIYRFLLAPGSNTCTIRALDTSKPWFIWLTSYIDIGGVLTEGDGGNEALWMPPGAPTFIHITNGNPAIVGYASNATVTMIGGSLDSMTNVASFTTNGVWRYQEALQSGPRYFKVITGSQ